MSSINLKSISSPSTTSSSPLALTSQVLCSTESDLHASVSAVPTTSVDFPSWHTHTHPIFYFPIAPNTQSESQDNYNSLQVPPQLWTPYPFADVSNNDLLTVVPAIYSDKNNLSEDAIVVGENTSLMHGPVRSRTKGKAGESDERIHTIEPSTSKAFIRDELNLSPASKKNSAIFNYCIRQKSLGISKSSSTSNLQNFKKDHKRQRRSPTVIRSSRSNAFDDTPPINEFVLRKLRPRESRNSRSPLAKKIEPSCGQSSPSNVKSIKDDRQSCSPFQIEEPIVVGDYSNPFDNENGDFIQEKMRDAIDLNRFLWLVDNYGFCKRPVYRPFLLRNLCYMQRKPHRLNTFGSNDNGSTRKIDKIKVSTVSLSSVSSNSPRKYFDGVSSPTELLMPSTIKFNFIRNNLCFGDRSAIVQCFCASEIDYEFGAFKRIPSATFDMKVNEKLSHIAIDLPGSFGTDFGLTSKARAEYFVVRVVFRYEDAEVGGGKRLRKVPSRQQTSPPERNSTSRTVRADTEYKQCSKPSQEVVMFGTKQIVSYSADCGLNVVHGETSIVLHTSEDLKIPNDCDGWMKDPSFLARILRLQRKTYDNPFMSIQVQNVNDDDDESSDGEDELSHKSARLHNQYHSNMKNESKQNDPKKILKSKKKESKRKLYKKKINNENNCRIHDENDDDKELVMRTKYDSKNFNVKFSSSVALNDCKSSIKAENVSEMIQSNATTSAIHNSTSIDPILPITSSNDYFEMGELSLPEKIAGSDKLHGDIGFSTIPSLNLGSGTMDNGLSQGAQDHTSCNMKNIVMPVMINNSDVSNNVNSFNSVMEYENDNNVVDNEALSITQRPLKPANNLKKLIRVLNTSYMCFFCLTQMNFKSLNALFMHLRLCHLRFKFEYEANIIVTRNVVLPGFVVSLNKNFYSFCEVNPTRHYIKLSCERLRPKKCHIQVEPIWVVTRRFARQVRQSWQTFEKFFNNLELYNSSLFKDFLLMDGGIRHGTRYCFEPPTKINHQWMIQSNSRNLSEITDLQQSERKMMQLWNDFLLDIRITLLGRNMVYKASRVFVDTKRNYINTNDLRIHFLFHLTNLFNFCCINEEERYDLFMRLSADYNPRFDTAHFVSRQIDSLNRERLGNNKLSQKHRSNSANSADDLRALFPFASNRRLEQIWKFMDIYSFDDFSMISSSSNIQSNSITQITLSIN